MRRWPTAVEWERIRRDINERCQEVLDLKSERQKINLKIMRTNPNRIGCFERALRAPSVEVRLPVSIDIRYARKRQEIGTAFSFQRHELRRTMVLHTLHILD